MEKSLDSDWLRALQFKCNNSAKSVIITPVQKVLAQYKLQRRFPKLVRGNSKHSKVIRDVLKVTEVYPKSSEDHPKISGD